MRRDLGVRAPPRVGRGVRVGSVQSSQPLPPVSAGTPLCHISDVCPIRAGLVRAGLVRAGVGRVEARSVAPGRFFPHYRAVAIWHANAANPYAACVISPPRFARNLPDTDLPAAA